MNEIVNIVFELLVNLLEGFIIIDFSSNFLGYKYVGYKKLMSFIIGISANFIYITFLNNIIVFEGISVFISVILLFCYCMAFTEGSILSKMFTAASTFITIIVINMIVLSSISYITQLDVTNLMSEASSARYVTVIITKVLFFFTTRVLLLFKSKEDFSLTCIEWIALSAIVIISIFVGNFIVIINIQNPYSDKSNIFVFLSMFGIAVINIITYYLLLRLSRESNKRLKYIMLEQEYKYQIKHNDDVKQLYKDISRVKHDMNNYFTCIIGMIEQDQKQHALKYIQDIIKEKINICSKYIETNNATANYILNSKLEICKKIGIDTKCCIIGDIDTIPEIDLCILLGNILDNAIEASQACVSPKIIINITSNKDHIEISIGNTISNSVLAMNPNFMTNKKEKKHHGYGVQNIKGIVTKYNGLIDYYEKNEMIYCHIII